MLSVTARGPRLDIRFRRRVIAERVVESVGMRGGGPQEGEDFRAFSRNRAPVMPNRISSTATASSLAVCVCV